MPPTNEKEPALNRKQIERIAAHCMETGRFNLFMQNVDNALLAPPAGQNDTASRDLVDALVAVLDARGLTRDLTERGMETLCDELRAVIDKAGHEPG